MDKIDKIVVMMKNFKRDMKAVKKKEIKREIPYI